MKSNAIAGHRFASWAALEAHLARWVREVADVRVHGTTGEAPVDRFARDEATALQPLGGRPPFRQLRELTRRVRADCCRRDRHEQLLRAVAADRRARGGDGRGRRVRILHAVREVAATASGGSAQRIVDPAHLDGVAGRRRVCRRRSRRPVAGVAAAGPRCCVLLPNTKRGRGRLADGERRPEAAVAGAAGAAEAVRASATSSTACSTRRRARPVAA